MGGNATRAAGDVIDFVAGLQDARQGSVDAQIAFNKIGVSLEDLGKLTEEDLFKKTVQGIANIGDAATRNALAVKMLGKSFKDVDIRQVASQMATGMGGGSNISAINAAADAQKNINALMMVKLIYRFRTFRYIIIYYM